MVKLTAMMKILLAFIAIYIDNGITSSFQTERNEIFLYGSRAKEVSLQQQQQQQQNIHNQQQEFQSSIGETGVIGTSYVNFGTDKEGEEDGFSGAGSNNEALIGGNGALDRGPYFDISASKNVTALVGKTVYLNCRIRNLGNKTVSWIRHRDLHLLTVGKMTYTSDQRFQSVNNPQTGDWSLQVRFPQQRDSGVYECQVSTTPPVGYSMVLSVVEPITTIVGGPDLYIDTGSTVNLTCIVRHLPEPPPLIQWTHNNEEINYDSPRGGVSVITEKGDITTSYLLIQRAKFADSGKYTCSPSNANPKTVNVHILSGEQPAAIQRGTKLQNMGNSVIIIITSLLIAMIQRYDIMR